MIRSLPQLVRSTLATTLVAAAFGLLAGYLLGRALTLRLTEARLRQYAARILTAAEGSSAEARTVLAEMNASPLPFCSDAEISDLRKLVFQSEYLKEAGRMREGRIACSAMLGHMEEPQPQFTPDISRLDGTSIYRNLPPFRIGDHTVITLRLRDSYIVYNPFNLKDLGSTSMHFTVSNVDPSHQSAVRLLGEVPQAQGGILTRDSEARVGESFYATRCSTRYTSCMTAFISIPEALEANRIEIVAYTLLGGLVGISFGLCGSMQYRRSQSMEQQLRRAIRCDKLQMVFQPIVELGSRQIVGAEALARWTDESGFAIPPDTFIRVAEEGGFVREITALAVRHILRDFESILRSRPEFQLNVNVAATDLRDPKFLPMLEQSLRLASIPARCLGIEITESSTARNQAAIETIHRLRERGHRVYIDDFGTGYSSLSYLHDLSVDSIKIDKSFTRAIGTEAVTMAILPQILSLAEALKLQVVVEGIETESQAEYFAGKGKEILAQGWLYGRPITAEAFCKQMAEENRAALANPEAA